jgi:hypothetical protein
VKLISSQGTQFKWGPIEFLVTSLVVNSGSSSEIDITSMSSRKIADKENTGKFFIERDWDSAFSSAAELSIEFFAEDWINDGETMELVGLKRNLTMSFPADDQGKGRGFSLTGKKAVLTQISLNASTAEFVTGSATFRLSGD